MKTVEDLRARLQDAVDASRIIKAFILYSPSPIVMLDSEHKIIIWTKAFVEEFGLDPDRDYSGVVLYDLIPCCYENNAGFHKAIDDELPASGILACATTCIIPQKCTHVQREYKVNPWPKNGHMGGVIVYFKNITKEKEFETILNTIPGYVFYKDLHNNNVWCNAELASDMGTTQEALIGKNWLELDPRNGSKYWKDDLEVIKSGTTQDMGEEWIMLEGGPRKIHTVKLPWFDNFGNIKGVIGYSQKLPSE